MYVAFMSVQPGGPIPIAAVVANVQAALGMRPVELLSDTVPTAIELRLAEPELAARARAPEALCTATFSLGSPRGR
jgi:hypothetical protein